MGALLHQAVQSPRNRRHTAPILLRLLPEQRERLENVAYRLGKTMTEYIRDAVMSYVLTHEEDLRVEKERMRETEEKKRPKGLGLTSNFRRNATKMIPNEAPLAKNYQPVPAPAPTTVVIQQAPAPATPGTDVKMLAAYVAAAGEDSIERETRERTVEGVLRAAAKSPEELERLAKTLDDELALLNAKQGDRPGALSRPASPWGWISKL